MQPINRLAPWEVLSSDGSVAVAATEKGLVATRAVFDQVKFADGSTMISAGAGLPSDIDCGTF